MKVGELSSRRALERLHGIAPRVQDRILPRNVEFSQLISVLISEHAKMKGWIEELGDALRGNEFERAKGLLLSLDTVFKQHIADEEAQILKLLIDAYGVKGANEAVVVFRQHRPIYELMHAIEEFNIMSKEELASNRKRLLEMLVSHTKLEEGQVFPWALTTYGSRPRE